MKKALVLGGGAAKGAYQAGFIQGLYELGVSFDIVCGTSIGALNGCLVSMGKMKELNDLWNHLSISSVIKGEFSDDFKLNFENLVDSRNLVISFFKSYIKEKGADISPLKQLMKNYLDESKLLSSPIDYGLCTVKYPSLKPVYITKKDMKIDNIFDYLLASASCFPVFPIHTFENESYIDGGYYDNLPIELALDMGADEIIAIDLKENVTHKHYLNKPDISYIVPFHNIGMMFDFSKETIQRNMRAGYNDCMKFYNHYEGVKYTFLKTDEHMSDIYYKDYLMIEKKIRKELGIDINKKFLEYHKDIHINKKNYFYICIDWLNEFLDKDETYVYCLEDLFAEVKDEFDLKEDRDYFNKIKDISKRDYIKKCVFEMNKYNGELEMNLLSPLFIKELLIARLIYLIIHNKIK